jgi:hypothetical protein
MPNRPLIVSNRGLGCVRASYRNAAIGWWFLAALIVAAAGTALLTLRA